MSASNAPVLLTHPPDPAKDTAASLSLFDIEQGLAAVLSEYEDCESDAERANVQQAIEAYVAAEVAKVDGIRSYLRHCGIMATAAKEEAQRFNERARAWEARESRLKEACLRVMDSAGKKKLEGNTGTLLVKGNGGLAPLNKTDESMIPDECCYFVGKVAAPLWLRTVKQCPWLENEFAGDSVKMERTVDNKLVRDALAKGPVAGAFLGERDRHLEVR